MRIKRRDIISAFAVVFIAAFIASDVSSQPSSSPPLDIVATTAMIGDAVTQIAGDQARVTVLMGEGVDPHTYRQTRSDVSAMTRATAVFWHGLNLEAQLTEFFEGLAKRKPVIAVGETGVPAAKLLSDQEGAKPDPHVWMDPRLWKSVVIAIRDELIKLSPASKAVFEANASRLLGEIDRLAVYSETVLATVPEPSRVLVTAHDAFKYFGKAYGYDVVGIQGISTESEAGLKQIEAIVTLLVDKKIKSVFVESSVSERNVKALIEGAAARGHKVEIGGELYSDAMGKPGSYRGTYIGMIDHNLTTIARALGGNASKNGLNGRLDAVN